MAGTVIGATMQSNDITGMNPKPANARLKRIGECIFTKAFWLARAHEPSSDPTISETKSAGVKCHNNWDRKIINSNACQVLPANFSRNGSGSWAKIQAA